ncbi:MAG: adenosine deaminase [Chloroflexota bacterium]
MAETQIHPYSPLIDLHRHLDGNVRLQTILDISKQNNLPLPTLDLEALRPYVQVTNPQPGLLAFFEKFQWQTLAMVDYDACYRIAYENVEDAYQEGLDYVELRFSPWFMAQRHGLDPMGVTESVIAGVAAGQKDFALPVGLIGILSRTYGPDTAYKELNALLTQREHIVALDLAGDEINYPGSLFVDHFKRGQEVGWEITVHAGEVTGAESIWQAVQNLGATRIGHGLRAIEDPALIDYLVEHEIGLEINLTSNVQISAVPDYESHPLRLLLEKGVKATINTDDPGISAIDLAHEYNVAAPKAGLTTAQIHQAQRNAFDIAFFPDESIKAALIKP